MIYPASIAPLAPYITMALVFIDGLLFGIAIRKAVVSIVLLVVAFMIAGFVSITFIPHISTSNFVANVTKYATTYASALHFTGIDITFTVILFIVGFLIGIWKG